MSALWAKITSSSRMIYFAGFCWWVLFAAWLWARVFGWSETQFVVQFFPLMAGLFLAALGAKTWTDLRKPNGQTPEGGTK